jgi:hypothetical protein
MTPVIFKIDSDGVCAFFPRELGTDSPFTCLCYAHIGQHGSAAISYAQLMRPAKPEEYAELMRELVRLGYDDIAPRRRFTQDDLRVRKEKLARHYVAA